jgi:hypothetical protein
MSYAVATGAPLLLRRQRRREAGEGGPVRPATWFGRAGLAARKSGLWAMSRPRARRGRPSLRRWQRGRRETGPCVRDLLRPTPASPRQRPPIRSKALDG